jgi:hypothetical protein
MQIETRASPRNAVSYAALDVEDGSPMRPRHVWDLSERQVKLIDSSLVLLASDWSARYVCEIVCREEDQIGIALLQI